MRSHIYTAAGIVALSGIALGAQTTSPSQPSTTAGGMQQISVTGCVQSWTQSGAGSTTPGAAGSPAGSAQQSMSDIRFKLTDVEKKDASSTMDRSGSATPGTPSGSTPTTGAGTPGTTGTATSGSTARSGEGSMDDHEYLLRAEGASVNLSQHLNHKVEVMGRVAAMSGTTGSGAMGTGTTGTTGTGATGTTGTTPRTPESGASTMRSAMGNSPVLTVTSIKMIANTCK